MGWCGREDSNLHGVAPSQPLNLVGLPDGPLHRRRSPSVQRRPSATESQRSDMEPAPDAAGRAPAPAVGGVTPISRWNMAR